MVELDRVAFDVAKIAERLAQDVEVDVFLLGTRGAPKQPPRGIALAARALPTHSEAIGAPADSAMKSRSLIRLTSSADLA
jgi:hypothetical protein